MRPITAWGHFMSSTVSVAAKSGDDGYGVPSYGTGVSYSAHIGRESKMVRSPTGQVVQSSVQVWLEGSPAVLPTARVTFSTGDVGSTEAGLLTPPIVAIERLFDGNGPHHTVLHF